MTTDSRNRLREGTLRLAAAAVAVSLLPLGGAAKATDLGVGQIQVAGLSTEHLANPLGIDTAAPRLSWID
jgi:hypothetical protein